MFEDFEISPMAFLMGCIGAGVVAVMLKYTVNAGTHLPWWTMILSPIIGFVGGYVVTATMTKDD